LTKNIKNGTMVYKQKKKDCPSLYDVLRLHGFTKSAALQYIENTSNLFNGSITEGSTLLEKLDGGVTPSRGTE